MKGLQDGALPGWKNGDTERPKSWSAGWLLQSRPPPPGSHLVYAKINRSWNPRGCHLPSEQTWPSLSFLSSPASDWLVSLQKSLARDVVPKILSSLVFFFFLSFLVFFFLWLHVTSNNGVIYGLQVASCCGSHTELRFLNLWLLPLWPWNHSSPLRSGHMASEGYITFKGRYGLAWILIFYFKLITVIKQWCV